MTTPRLFATAAVAILWIAGPTQAETFAAAIDGLQLGAKYRQPSLVSSQSFDGNTAILTSAVDEQGETFGLLVLFSKERYRYVETVLAKELPSPQCDVNPPDEPGDSDSVHTNDVSTFLADDGVILLSQAGRNVSMLVAVPRANFLRALNMIAAERGLSEAADQALSACRTICASITAQTADSIACAANFGSAGRWELSFKSLPDAGRMGVSWVRYTESQICGIDRVVAEKEGVRVVFLSSENWDGHSSSQAPFEIENGTVKRLTGGSFQAPVYHLEAGLLLGKGQHAILVDPRARLGGEYSRCDLEVTEADDRTGVKATATAFPRKTPYQPPVYETKFIPAEEAPGRGL
jgi:hypothetical protein